MLASGRVVPFDSQPFHGGRGYWAYEADCASIGRAVGYALPHKVRHGKVRRVEGRGMGKGEGEKWRGRGEGRLIGGVGVECWSRRSACGGGGIFGSRFEGGKRIEPDRRCWVVMSRALTALRIKLNVSRGCTVQASVWAIHCTKGSRNECA